MLESGDESPLDSIVIPTPIRPTSMDPLVIFPLALSTVPLTPYFSLAPSPGRLVITMTSASAVHVFSAPPMLSHTPDYMPSVSLPEFQSQSSSASVASESLAPISVRTRKHERLSFLSELEFVGMLQEHGFECIRIWKDKNGYTFYDCDCQSRKPIRNLSKIRKHVVIAHRKFSGVKVEAEDESDMKHHDAGEDFQDV